jgi:hypothetical protein
MKKINPIKIKINKEGIGKVYLDGKDISKYVTNMRININAGEIPTCDITVSGDIDLDGDFQVNFEKEK